MSTTLELFTDEVKRTMTARRCSWEEGWHLTRMLSPTLYNAMQHDGHTQQQIALANEAAAREQALSKIDPSRMTISDRIHVSSGQERAALEREALGLPAETPQDVVSVAFAANGNVYGPRNASNIFAGLARHVETPLQQGNYNAGFESAKTKYPGLWAEINGKKS
ncbi:MAG: hypothetical protein HY043_22770 [Verrucomicrobia bacterium]|nr:hypothetical protein [Verrucomicrobiota bacterium]